MAVIATTCKQLHNKNWTIVAKAIWHSPPRSASWENGIKQPNSQLVFARTVSQFFMGYRRIIYNIWFERKKLREVQPSPWVLSSDRKQKSSYLLKQGNACGTFREKHLMHGIFISSVLCPIEFISLTICRGGFKRHNSDTNNKIILIKNL